MQSVSCLSPAARALLGLDIGTGALADARSEWIVAGEIALHERFIHDGASAAVLAGRTGIALVEIAASKKADTEGSEETGADGVQVDQAIGPISTIVASARSPSRPSSRSQP